MDIGLLTSINRVALGFFVVVLLALLYQIFIVLKSGKKKPDVVDIPAYKPQGQHELAILKNATPLKARVLQPQTVGKKSSSGTLIFLWFLLVITALVVLFTSLMINFLQGQLAQVKGDDELVAMLKQTRILVYDTSWQPVNNNKLYVGSVPYTVYLALPLEERSDITKVRMRVNSSTWQPSDETNLYDKARRVWYKEYTITTSPAQLKIEAQVYREGKGWFE